MKPSHLVIVALILLYVVPSTPRQVTAQTSVPLPPNWQPIVSETDSASHASLSRLVAELYTYSQSLQHNLEVGRLHLQAHTYGKSTCQRQGIAGRLLPHLLPFQCSPEYQNAFQAISNVTYQWPGEMHTSALLLHSNNRRKGQKIMHELYQTMLPIYSISRYRDEGSKKSFVMPFYDIGPWHYSYQYAPVDTVTLNELNQEGIDFVPEHLCYVKFTPLRQHHTLLNGLALVDSVSLRVLKLDCSGRIDLATFRSRILFCPDTLFQGQYMPHTSDIDIHYRYMRTRASNNYHTLYKYVDYTPLDSLDRRSIPLDLTYYYSQEPELADSSGTWMQMPLPYEVDSIFQSQSRPTKKRHRRSPYQETLGEWGETLISGTHIGNEESRLRIYGPLDPATLGYDKFNGITIREQARYNGRFSNGQTLYLRGEIGYAFRLNELRWRLFSEYTYLPQHRGRLTLEARRSNSTFSSRFIQTINDALQQDPNTVHFDSLGIEYYHRYDFDLRHSIELTNGLMLHVGIDYTRRRPVMHGVRKASAERREELIDHHYSDFAPYILLEYTPRQYYWYDHGYKRYISSPAPTFALELTRAIPGALDAWSNYGRAEFDMQQLIRISRTRNIAYHLGLGKFFNRRGEYFINYRYFARSQYPETWEDDRIGGAFHLLDDYWYSSSPSYLQAHFMHETPFGLFHRISPISRYVIKERIYWGALWAEGKSIYNELGYGIDNNFFNVGAFVGFKDAAYYGFGVKFRIEIGSHI